MILRIDVNDGDMSKNSYQIGMADLASCDFDVAEILGYQTVLSPSDEELVGGYLAAKYGISTAYPACAGLASASTLTNSPASAQTSTSATLNTTLACPGSVYDVRVYWGTTNGGTDAGLWENSATVGTWTDVASTKLSHTVTGLTPGAKYYFTFRGTNAVDSFWADKVLTFRPDLPAVQEPGKTATSSPVADSSRNERFGLLVRCGGRRHRRFPGSDPDLGRRIGQRASRRTRPWRPGPRVEPDQLETHRSIQQ